MPSNLATKADGVEETTRLDKRITQESDSHSAKIAAQHREFMVVVWLFSITMLMQLWQIMSTWCN